MKFWAFLHVKSVSLQLFVEVWPYGGIWCELWKAIDVWLCTASIYNLVAISFDRLQEPKINKKSCAFRLRYMAVTRPISYRFISSRKTGKYLVLAAWAVSFVISAPPLVINFVLSESQDEDNVHNQCKCTPMNNSDGYIIYRYVFWAFLIDLFHLTAPAEVFSYRWRRFSFSITVSS